MGAVTLASSDLLLPSGQVVQLAADPEMMALLTREAPVVGLEWTQLPPPEPSRLDDWFLGAARVAPQCAPRVPFFPEVHEELTRSWGAPFSSHNRPCLPSPLTFLDGGVAKG